MTSHTNGTQSPISPDLLEILRDPQAIQAGDKYGADPGYKYPIRDGIPVMLIEEGARWKDTPVDALPVPPPAAEPPPVVRTTEPTSIVTQSGPDYRILLAAAAVLLLLLALVSLGRKRSANQSELPPPA